MGIMDIFGGGGSDVKPPDISELIPYLEAQQQLNQVDQVTPYGSVKYNTTYNEPQSYDDWFGAQSPSIFKQNIQPIPNWDSSTEPGTDRGDHAGSVRQPRNQRNYKSPQALYNDYVANFDKGLGETTATHTFSPEIQGLFDKQFDPNAYQNYSDDYMSRYSELMQPDRDYRTNRFEQNMFDRGQPVGGAEYGDKYRQTIGDPNARQDTMAAGQAANAADAARLQDYNRMASAFGMSQLPVPGVDVMGPANMFMNANQINAQNENQSSSNLWNALGALGGGYAMGGGWWD